MADKHQYDVLDTGAGKPVKLWTRGVPVEGAAREQLVNTARMPFIFRHLAVMPDVHLGKGSTIGSVIPTVGAVIPAAVGVDIGCGMMAVKTSLTAADLPDNLGQLRSAIEHAVPHGRSAQGGRRDQGAWGNAPAHVDAAWAEMAPGFRRITDKYPHLARANHRNHLGTLGTGNHFIEVCLDEAQSVWFMLHSGSRGIGNAIGTTFITLAQQDMRQHLANLPDRDLAYLVEGSAHYEDYVYAVSWAQAYARRNRELMMEAVLAAAQRVLRKPFQAQLEAVNCHHNYVQKEHHFGADVLVTRKGAVSARAGELGIIPGSMGARSFIVRGKGNPESFCSCSHGAGRTMSRSEAKRRFTVADQKQATQGVECRKDAAVIDEIPMAYKDIDAVMAAQADLVEVVHTLRQVVCVKG
ncbi:RtcB family protein [Cupriavidus alkaliphilus]|uniref:3'-phosphate/5'-hydroxy nucleic acid ligase n=1 Tax=Cupriavidus alkaliphilus TaxID=942866 RepID=A0A7W4YSH0_9BURK|nr:RtcB family protein [Cupriavidus alkaliphilus]MBB3009658.1 tRNA-splicing ligase RtcB [Cupriavidus alkaliphilus]PVY79847.1 tRNA-splicing ligase RtcB [Cupriavidus alkaliphilus]